MSLRGNAVVGLQTHGECDRGETAVVGTADQAANLIDVDQEGHVAALASELPFAGERCPTAHCSAGSRTGNESLEPLDFRGRHDHGRTAIDGVDDGDRFQVAVLDEGGRDAVGDPQPIESARWYSRQTLPRTPCQRWRGFLSFRICPIYAPRKSGTY